MNFLKRAVLAVMRKKVRTVTLFVLFAAVANMVLAGLAIQHATQYAGTLARQKLGAQVTLMFDRQSAMQKAEAAGTQRPRIQSEPITEAMAKTVAVDKNIIGFNYLVNANGVADGFKAVESSDSNQQQNNAQSIMFPGRNGGSQNSDYVMPDVTVTGVSDTGLTDAFKAGDAAVVSGRSITMNDADQKAALISDALAQQNSLKLGDKIKIKAARSGNEIELAIVGIYKPSATSTSNSQGGGGFNFIDPNNRIYTDYKSAIPLKTVTTDAGTTQGGIDSAVFFVNDPSNIDTVKADAKTMNIDWSKYTLDANDAAYKQMMGPIDNVASFSITVVYIVAIAGALILALILLLSIKERMYETGVLLSMGEGKLKIIGQYLVEALLIAVLAFGVSTISGKYIAQGVGNTLLNREVQVEQQQSASGFNPSRSFQSGRMGRQDVESIKTMNISVEPSEVGKMSEVGLLILLMGTILPASAVMRYRPNAILTKA